MNDSNQPLNVDAISIDAVERNKQHPNTFQIPSSEEIATVKPQDWVKILVGRERFWVSILEVTPDTFIGEVDNDLLFTDEHGLVCGQKIEFSKNRVLDISPK